MNLTFFDANVACGRPMRKQYQSAETAPALRRELKKAGITRSLVWHCAQHDYAAPEGNDLLSRAIKKQPALAGCWTILSPQTGEVIKPGFFRRMKRDRIAALRAFPAAHHYLLRRATFGRFLDEVSERRIPLLLSVEKDGLGWPAVYDLMADYPKLTCVLCDLGIWNTDRYSWPLLETHPNLHLETSLLGLADFGLEATARRFGAERLIFGSNFPERYCAAAVLPVIHADLTAADKRKIASGNLDSLVRQTEL